MAFRSSHRILYWSDGRYEVQPEFLTKAYARCCRRRMQRLRRQRQMSLAKHRAFCRSVRFLERNPLRKDPEALKMVCDIFDQLEDRLSRDVPSCAIRHVRA